MKEGTVPVPLDRPCACCDDDLVPVLGVFAFFKDKEEGVKPLLSVYVFLQHFR
jgi:hypothetical protein